MSKVGEYYRELSELGIDPRHIRKQQIKPKSKKKDAEKSKDKSA